MADFLLTRRAFLDLEHIYAYSVEQWGVDQAERYMERLYERFAYAARFPQHGETRKARSAPFLMLNAGVHFIVYDRSPRGVVILAVIEQVRDVEAFVREFAETLAEERREISDE